MNSIYRNFSASFVLCYFILSCSYVKAADIISTALGGKWSDKTTWVGGNVPNQTDNVIITSTVTANGGSYTSTSYPMNNLTIGSTGKIIREKNSGGLSYLKISGNLTNNGEIIDYNDYFDIDLSGNLINNGVFKPRYINLTGENQQVSGTKAIECKQINLNMKDEFVIANSNLLFKNCRIVSSVSVNIKKLKMNKFSLSLTADSIRYDAYYGTVSSSSELVIPILFEGEGILTLDNSLVGGTIIGNVLVKSPSYAFFKDLTVEGNLIFDDGTQMSSQGNFTKIRIKGDFTNFAKLNKDTVRVRKIKFAPRSMSLYLYGNSNNLGSTGISTVYPTTNGKTISLNGNYEGAVYLQQAENSDKSGGKVLINSEVNISGKLDVYANLEIAQGGILNLLNKSLTSPVYVRTEVATLTNNGIINRYHKVNNSWSYRSFSTQEGMFADYELREWSERIEGVDISVFNNQYFPGLPGSVKRWWRINPDGAGKVKYYTLKLYYDESLLNGQEEKNLKVFRSGDKGITWNLISLGSNATLDTIENSISIGKWNIATSMLTEFGDFVISSGDGSVPIPSPIIVDIVGSPNVRLGAPNRYTVHLYNVGNSRTESFYTVIAISKNIIFKQIEIPTIYGKIVLPIDSIGTPKDDMQFFYIPYLEPNEQYSFDVIVTGVHEGTKSTSLEETYVTATCVINDMRHRYIKDGLNGVLNNYQLKELNAEEQAKLDEKVKQMLKQIETDKKNEGSGAVAQAECLKRMFENLGFPAQSIHWLGVNIGTSLELLDRTTESYRQCVWNWLNNQDNSTENEGIKLVDGKLIKGKIVTSWDPNEKLGPAGYGVFNHIAQSGKMNYTIRFENKKEATAAAYRIQIVDTLSAFFDPGTVKFGPTSHSGSSSNWKMERIGNVIKWDIEGIELPPNVIPPQGEGFVSFSVDLKENMTSGTKIMNAATIVFDMNPAIRTNTWINIIDSEAPKTVMQPIRYANGDPVLTVACNTTDNVDGSGPNKYMFYGSVNNSPFTFIGESYKNSIEYPVSSTGTNTYRFYALATDNVDNTEVKVPQIVEIKSAPVSAKQIDQVAGNSYFYPNPTSGLVSLGFITEIHTLVEIHIFSITGKLVRNQSIGWFSEGKHRIDLDITDLEKGVYFTKVKFANKEENYKLIRK